VRSGLHSFSSRANSSDAAIVSDISTRETDVAA